MGDFYQDTDNLNFKDSQVADYLFDGAEGRSSETTRDISTEKSPGPGRPTLKSTRLFSKFTKTSTKTPPKKANFRTSLIRGLRKCLRNIHHPKRLTQRINYLSFLSAPHLLSDLRSQYDQHRTLIDTCLVPYEDYGQKSFNNRFFRKALEEDEVKKCVKLYLNFVFFDVSPKKMREKLGFMCCPAKEHSEECFQKWEELKRFCTEELFPS